jgi:hypothetical protein
MHIAAVISGFILSPTAGEVYVAQCSLTVKNRPVLDTAQA